MATRTISDAGGNAGAVTCWVGGLLPGMLDDVVCTPTSGSLTMGSIGCRSLDLTGYTGSIANVSFTVGYTTRNSVFCVIPSGITFGSSVNMYLNDQSAGGPLPLNFGSNFNAVSITVGLGSYYASADFYCYSLALYSTVALDMTGFNLNVYNGGATTDIHGTLNLTNSIFAIGNNMLSSQSVLQFRATSNIIFSNTTIKARHYATFSDFRISKVWDCTLILEGTNTGERYFYHDIILTNLIVNTASYCQIRVAGTLTITGKLHTYLNVGMNAMTYFWGGTITKASGIVDLFMVNIQSTIFAGGATWNVHNGSTIATNYMQYVNWLGGEYFIDPVNGSDANVHKGFGWWRVEYTNPVGPAPTKDDTATGGSSLATAKLCKYINLTEWEYVKAGTLYFYGKAGTFQSEVLNFSSGGSCTITADFTYSAIKTAWDGTNSNCFNSGDTLKWEKIDPVETGINALWTSVTRVGGGLYSLTSFTATNASPIVVTKAAHDLANNAIVNIHGVTGNTAMNGLWRITVLSSSTFSLNNSVGNGTASGGTIIEYTQRVLQLSEPVTAMICNCNTLWTGGTGVTVAQDFSYLAKLGAGSMKLTANCGANQIVGKFGLAAPIDLSGYQQISFWFRNDTSAIVANTLEVRLYSDAACTNLVETFPIFGTASFGTAFPVTVDKGSALSSSVQGVAVYTTVALAKALYIDCIIACKAPSDAKAITLQTLVSKNINVEADDCYHCVQAIQDTFLVLDYGYLNAQVVSSGRNYEGITETVALWKREASYKLPLTFSTYYQAVLPLRRSPAGLPCYYSGGWDKATNTRTGYTVFEGLTCWGYTFSPSSLSTIANMIIVRTFVGLANSVGLCDYINLRFACCSTAIYSQYPIRDVLDVKAVACGQGINFAGTFRILSNIVLKGNNGAGIYTTYGAIVGGYINNVVLNNNVNGLFASNSFWGLYNTFNKLNFNTNGINLNSGTITPAIAYIGECCWNGTGIYSTGQNLQVDYIDKLNDNTNGLYLGSLCVIKEINEFNRSKAVMLAMGGFGTEIRKVNQADSNYMICNGGLNWGSVRWYNTDFTNFLHPTGANINFNSQEFYLLNCSGIDFSKISNNIYTSTGGKLCVQLKNGACLTLLEFCRITSETTERHTASGLSWKMEIYSNGAQLIRSNLYPVHYPLAKIYCHAGKVTTVGLWVKKNHAVNIEARLNIKSAIYEGVTPTAQDDLFCLAANHTDWQQLAFAFTPTNTGVVEVEILAYTIVSGTYSVYFDDMAINEAP